ncbi:Aristolochene synthase in complex with 12,13-Difluorofarnesyl diphosphate [Xylariaceae sp. FL1651]|nr:Aristolochene synthase in complex with 12,13-Difluorofarnesyl diphosphate [Xylariaceae sp. FL1651]
MVGYEKSTFELRCHSRLEEVEHEVNEYFLTHWPFPNDSSRERFLGGRFARCTCMYFPDAKDDRIHFACRLLTLLFLIDDILETMSFEEGAAYNGRLISVIRGEVTPNRSVAVEVITFDLWESMRAHDAELAEGIMKPLFIFMRSQTDKIRGQSMTLMQYFDYRDKDIGQALLASLMRFVLEIRLSIDELAAVKPADVNMGRHILVLNDIWSYEKEAQTARNTQQEGGILCNSVAILSAEADLSAASSKRVLLHMCREWEYRHRHLLDSLLSLHTQDRAVTLTAYFRGLAAQMCGNEHWSKLTSRYNCDESELSSDTTLRMQQNGETGCSKKK